MTEYHFTSASFRGSKEKGNNKNKNSISFQTITGTIFGNELSIYHKTSFIRDSMLDSDCLCEEMKEDFTWCKMQINIKRETLLINIRKRHFSWSNCWTWCQFFTCLWVKNRKIQEYVVYQKGKHSIIYILYIMNNICQIHDSLTTPQLFFCIWSI